MFDIGNQGNQTICCKGNEEPDILEKDATNIEIFEMAMVNEKSLPTPYFHTLYSKTLLVEMERVSERGVKKEVEREKET